MHVPFLIFTESHLDSWSGSWFPVRPGQTSVYHETTPSFADVVSRSTNKFGYHTSSVELMSLQKMQTTQGCDDAEVRVYKLYMLRSGI